MMVLRRPDGSLVAWSPEAAAERLQVDNPGWKIWVGGWTHNFLALHPDVPRLVTARSADEMAHLIGRCRELARR